MEPHKQPGMPPTDSGTQSTLQRALIWINTHRPQAWLIAISLVLLVMILVLPAEVLSTFWNAVVRNTTVSAMLVIFSLLSLSLIWSAGERLDSWVFLVFNVYGLRPIWLDRIMAVLTELGSGVTASIIAGVFFVLGSRLIAYVILLGTLTLWLIVEMFKWITQRDRPYTVLQQARVIGFKAGGRSFPSGHTSQSFFMATILAQHFQASFWLTTALYAAALLVGITRMYVGAHYPRDVLAGSVLGTLWGLLAGVIYTYASGRIG